MPAPARCTPSNRRTTTTRCTCSPGSSASPRRCSRTSRSRTATCRPRTSCARSIGAGGRRFIAANPPNGSRLTCAISTSLISSLSVIGPADATSPRFLSRKGQETNRRHSTDWPHGNICHRPDVCRGGATASAGRVRAPLLSGSLGGYDGLALILLGIAIVVVAATRFVRTGQLLDDEETHSVGGVRAELLLSAAAGDLFTTYIHVSVDLSHGVTNTYKTLPKKGLCRVSRPIRTLLLR